MQSLRRKFFRKQSFKKNELIHVVKRYFREHWKSLISGAAAVGAGMYYMKSRPHKITKSGATR